MKKRPFKIIKTGGLILFVLGIGLMAIIFWSENDKAVIKQSAKNEDLPTIKTDWQGTPVDENDRFVNAEFPFLPKISDMLKWQFGARPQKAEKQADTERLEIKDPTDFLNADADGICGSDTLHF